MGIFSSRKKNDVVDESIKSSQEPNKMVQTLTSEPLFIYNGYSNQSFNPLIKIVQF